MSGWGIEAEVIIYAIKQTAWAPHPSPYYMRAILDRYKMSNIRSMGEVHADRMRREAERDSAKAARWAAWYGEDDY